MEEQKNKGVQALTDDELEEAAGGGMILDTLRAVTEDILGKTKNLLYIRRNGDSPLHPDGLVYYENKEELLKAQLLPSLDTPEELLGTRLPQKSGEATPKKFNL